MRSGRKRSGRELLQWSPEAWGRGCLRSLLVALHPSGSHRWSATDYQQGASCHLPYIFSTPVQLNNHSIFVAFVYISSISVLLSCVLSAGSKIIPFFFEAQTFFFLLFLTGSDEHSHSFFYSAFWGSNQLNHNHFLVPQAFCRNKKMKVPFCRIHCTELGYIYHVTFECGTHPSPFFVHTVQPQLSKTTPTSLWNVTKEKEIKSNYPNLLKCQWRYIF